MVLLRELHSDVNDEDMKSDDIKVYSDLGCRLVTVSGGLSPSYNIIQSPTWYNLFQGTY